MLQVFQRCLRHQLRRSTVSAAAAANGAVPLSRAQWRPQNAGRDCTVEPNLEEEFVFLDCTDQENPQQNPEQQKDLLANSRCPPVQHGHATDSVVKHLKFLDQLPSSSGSLWRDGSSQLAPTDSLIQFNEPDFPLDQNQSLVPSSSRKKLLERRSQQRTIDTLDTGQPVSDARCSGCGAMLHCTDAMVPGYMPSDKYIPLVQQGRLGGAWCQRCHLLTHQQRALPVQVTRHQYQEVVSRIRPLKALVLLVVDLLDLPDSIVPELGRLVGTNKQIVILGNKVDLLPADAPNYLQRIKRQLSGYCREAGFGSQVREVHLISAKTGYGVEALISSLQTSWKSSSDVYLVGSANTGKSTLFNTLLESDYCRYRTPGALRRATVSPWPGTTLNVVKFPIAKMTPQRMFRRRERLLHGEMSLDERRRAELYSRKGYLVGPVGRTFGIDRSRQEEIQFDPDQLALGEEGETERKKECRLSEFSTDEDKAARWLIDTPGILKDFDVLSVLSDQEVRLVVPCEAVVPRTYILKVGTSLFVGGMFRIDFLQGPTSCWFSVLSSARIPVHVTALDNADSIYRKHAGHALLGVPVGGLERMETFPPLVPQEFHLEGRGPQEAAADITLSSAGWVAVTAVEGAQVLLRVHAPTVAAVGVRTPPLLPRVVMLRGARRPKSPAYKTLKWVGPPQKWHLDGGTDGMTASGKRKRS